MLLTTAQVKTHFTSNYLSIHDVLEQPRNHPHIYSVTGSQRQTESVYMYMSMNDVLKLMPHQISLRLTSISSEDL